MWKWGWGFPGRPKFYPTKKLELDWSALKYSYTLEVFLTSRSFAHLSLPASIVLLLYFCFPCLLFVHIGNIYPSLPSSLAPPVLYSPPFCVQAPRSSLTSWHSLVMRETSVKAESRILPGTMCMVIPSSRSPRQTFDKRRGLLVLTHQ